MGRSILCMGLAMTFGCLEPGDPVLPPIDTAPPQFVSVSPPEGSVIEPDEVVLVTFSERMEPRSMRPGLYFSAGGQVVSSTIVVPPDVVPDEVDQTDRPWTCSIRGELFPAAEYHLVIDPLLTDTEANPISLPSGGPIRLLYRTTP